MARLGVVVAILVIGVAAAAAQLDSAPADAAALLAQQAAADGSVFLPAAAPAPVDTSVCEAIAGFIGAQWPPKGTMFCPSRAGWNAWAILSGYKTGWAELWAAVQASPGGWAPYFTRLMSYLTVGDFVPSGSLLPGTTLNLESTLTVGKDADTGSPVQGLLTVRAAGTTVTVYSQWYKSYYTRVLKKDAVLTGDGLSVVHITDKVIMPDNTYHTLYRAMRATKNLSNTARYMYTLQGAVVNKAASFVSVIAPDNTAWLGLKFINNKAPGWAGNITSATVAKYSDLRASLLKYSIVQLPRQDITGVINYEMMLNTWLLAGGANNFVSIPTALTSGGNPQLLYYTYDPPTDKMYVVGGRNYRAAPVMAGAPLGKTVLYGGCGTLMTVGKYVPLPDKTNLLLFDPKATAPSAKRRRAE